MTRPRDNPFSASRVTAVPFRLKGESWDDLVRRLDELGGRASVVGPHGSGKSTLLAALARELAARGVPSRTIRIGPGSRRLPAGSLRRPRRDEVLLVDGAERLAAPGILCLRLLSRRTSGLVLTLHAPGALPALVVMAPDEALFLDLVAELAGPERAGAYEASAREAFRRSRGNLRTALRELYDVAAARGEGA